VSRQYDFLPSSHFSPGDIVHSVFVKDYRDIRVMVDRETGQVDHGREREILDCGGQRAAFRKGRFAIVLTKRATHMNVLPIYSFGNTGLKNKREDEWNDFLNLKAEGDESYMKQHRRIPDKWTLEVQHPSEGSGYKPRTGSVVCLSQAPLKHYDTRVELKGSLTAESTSKLKALWLAYQVFLTSTQEERLAHPLLQDFPWLRGSSDDSVNVNSNEPDGQIPKPSSKEVIASQDQRLDASRQPPQSSPEKAAGVVKEENSPPKVAETVTTRTELGSQSSKEEGEITE
jgi:hypothetical protein